MKLTKLYPEYIEQAVKLYEAAFPVIERRPTDLWITYMQNQPAFNAQAILNDNNEFCGFITTWDFDTFIYGEHFAILPEMRNGGFGGKAYDMLLEQCHGKNLVIEVEIPDNEMAQRRIKFYERHNMAIVEQDYLQPPYTTGGEYFPLRLMSSAPEQTAANFEQVKTTIHREVYGVL